MNLISKKDLLALTGISYGQLYRWKREGLIPEEWFVKQSSYTGQETFLPREQALSRVRSILEMKDSHSLDELAAILSPTAAETVPTIPILNIDEIEPEYRLEIARLLGKSDFTILELTVILCLVRIGAPLEKEALLALVAEGMAAGLEDSNYTCVIFTYEGKHHAAFVKGTTRLILSPDFVVISAFHLGVSSDLLNSKYNTRRNEHERIKG